MATRAKDVIAVKRQSAIETPVVAGMVPKAVTGSLGESFTVATKQSGRTNANNGANLPREGQHSWSGTIPSELDATDSLFFFQELLGDNTDSADTPVAGAHQHVIIPTTTAADLTQKYTKGFTIGANGTDDSTGEAYGGCIVTAIEIPETENGNYPLNVEWMSRQRTEVTSATTGSVAAEGQVFCNLQAVIKAGVDTEEVTQDHVVGSIRMEQTGIEPHYRGTSNLLKRWVQADDGNIDVTGTFEIEMSDTEYAAVIDDFTNNDTLSVQLIFTTDIFITGSTPYSLTFDMPECKYTMVEARTDGHLRLMKFTFTAGQDTGSNLVSITAINGTAAIAA